MKEIKEFLLAEFFHDEPLFKNSLLDMGSDSGWLRRDTIENIWKEIVLGH